MSAPSADIDSVLDQFAAARQGSMFSIKPYIMCIDCNREWGRIEDEMVRFSKPIFTTFDPVSLTPNQTRVIIVWISLITILSEFSKGNADVIPKGDRQYLERLCYLHRTGVFFTLRLEAIPGKLI
jgi:hypothetical protein